MPEYRSNHFGRLRRTRRARLLRCEQLEQRNLLTTFTEIEPNDTFETAQLLEGDYPLEVTGIMEPFPYFSIGGGGNSDFFKFNLPASTQVVIEASSEEVLPGVWQPFYLISPTNFGLGAAILTDGRRFDALSYVTKEPGEYRLEALPDCSFGDLCGLDVTEPRSYQVKIRTVEFPKLKSFKNHSEMGKLAITYELPEDGIPFTFEFFSDATKLNHSIEVAAGNPDSELLTKGTHTLLVDPSDTDLASAIENENADVIRVTIKSDDEIGIPFRGFYQKSAESVAVVRSGSGTDDDVTIGGSGLSLGGESYSTTVSSASEVLVVTGDGDDTITLIGSPEGQSLGSVTIVGGEGQDKYKFESSLTANVRIGESADDVADSLNFSQFTSPDLFSGVRIDLDKSTQQEIAEGLSLTFDEADSVEIVVGSPLADVIQGSLVNATTNTFWGEGGNDLLIGGGGTDTLRGGHGSDVILGDGFLLTGINTLSDVFGDFPSKINVAVGMEPIAGSPDFLYGDHGEDLIIGGDGNDTIEGNQGNTLILGDDFKFKLDNELVWNAANLFAGGLEVIANLIDPDVIDPAGSGMDTITGGTGSNIVIGGGGNDTITGGNGAFDILFGNGGSDTIDGSGGVNFMVGGEGSDPMLKGGDSVDVILGDDFSLDVAATFDLSKLKKDEPQLPVAMLQGFSAQLEGDGDDVIETGDGVNLVLGGEGNDTITGGSGAFDALFGNDDEDEIDGKNGVNLIVGGDDDDKLLKGGDSVDVIIGDSIEYTKADVKMPSFDSPDKQFFKQVTEFFKSGLDLFGDLKLVHKGDDRIEAGDGFNLVFGGHGDDTINGGKDFDILFGDGGKDDDGQPIGGEDTIVGGNGTDLIIGGEDDDFLYGRSKNGPFEDGANIIFGDNVDLAFEFDLGVLAGEFTWPSVDVGITLTGDGDDQILGGDGFDFLVGGDGSDSIKGRDGLNIAFGDDFSQAITLVDFLSSIVNPVELAVKAAKQAAELAYDAAVETIEEWIYGPYKGSEENPGDENDRYLGGKDTDIVFGGGGDDTLTGGLGFDILVGGGKDDTIKVGPDEGNPQGSFETFGFGFGGPGKDTIYGGDGDDLLGSTLGNDTFYGGDGNDSILGGEDNDQLFGEAGDDALFGDGGDDLLVGGPGDDELFGGTGNDTLSTGLGKDRLMGGDGSNSIQSEIADSIDTDKDGVVDPLESLAANEGDGNRDSVADSEQSHVLSVPHPATDAVVTLQVGFAQRFGSVAMKPSPDPSNPPTSNLDHSLGFLITELLDVDATGEARLTLHVEGTFDSLYSFGATVDNPEPHYYRFHYDGRTGAEIFEDRIVIHFRDGERGDDDLIEDGIIRLQIAPAVNPSSFPFQNPLMPRDVNDDGNVTVLDALNVINALARYDGAFEVPGDLPSPVIDFMFLDANADGKVSALDALVIINELGRRSQSIESELVEAERIESPLAFRSKNTLLESGEANHSGDVAAAINRERNITVWTIDPKPADRNPSPRSQHKGSPTDAFPSDLAPGIEVDAVFRGFGNDELCLLDSTG